MAGATSPWRLWSWDLPVLLLSRSSRVPRLLAQQAGRLEDHDQDQIGEHHRRCPRRAEREEPEQLVAVVGELLDEADDEAAQHRALDVADAAHDRRGEGDQAGREALKV